MFIQGGTFIPDSRVPVCAFNNSSNKCFWKLKVDFNFCQKVSFFGAQTTPASNIIFISSQLNPRHHKSLKTERKKEGAQFYS